MIYALYYKNRLVYKNACKDLTSFKRAVNNRKTDIFKKVGYTDEFNNFNKLFNTRVNCKVEKWQIIKYRNYKEVKTIYTEPYTKRKRNKKNVANYFYVFDTESTNFNNKYAFTYLYGIRKYNYYYYTNDDNIEQYAEDYIYFNSPDAIKEFTDYLLTINKEALKNDELVYIYVHNLNYDLFELIQNVFNKCTYTDDDITLNYNDSIFKGSPTKPLRFRFKNIVFMDSLSLTNKSLAKISDSHKIKKQEELKTYKEQYFLGSKLPENELIYNRYDLDVTALGVYDSIRSCKQYFETFNDFCASYVSTVTGISKFLNKHIFPDEKENKTTLQKHTAHASNNLPIIKNEKGKRAVDVDRLKKYQNAFTGGETHANPFIAYNVLINNDDYIFISYDKKSHYPATMTMRYFPYKMQEETGDLLTILKEYENENIDTIGLNNYNLFIENMENYEARVVDRKLYRNYQAPHKYYFIAEIEITDLTIKFYNTNCFPVISVSKTNLTNKDYFKKQNVIDNGKLLKAKKFRITVTNIDLLNFRLFYDFKITACFSLESTINKQYADDYIQNTIRYHLVKKQELDDAINRGKPLNELKDFTGSNLFTGVELTNIQHMTDAQKDNFLHAEYQATKTNGLNNQYGINVQKIVNDNITFNLKTFEYEKELNTIQGCQGTQTTRDYITGMYITAYARLDLCYMAYRIFNELPTAQVCYWDTDSLKVKVLKTERSKLDAIFKSYNDNIYTIRQQSVNKYGTLYKLGIWELDGEYKYFYTLGAKKYVICDFNNNIKVTNAGINKRAMSDFLTGKYQELLKTYDPLTAFTELINGYYHPNIIYGTDITKRRTITYPKIHDTIIKIKVRDENGDVIMVNQYPTALITDCDYSLTDLRGSHLTNKAHYQLCRRLQLNQNIAFYCNTEYKEIGAVIGVYTDEKSDFIID